MLVTRIWPEDGSRPGVSMVDWPVESATRTSFKLVKT